MFFRFFWVIGGVRPRRYAFSFYKAFGPHLAVLYGRRNAFDAVLAHAPNHPFVDPENHGPARWELGTMNQVEENSPVRAHKKKDNERA